MVHTIEICTQIWYYIGMDEKLKGEIKRLQKIIDSSKRVVFLGGAGVSTESGIPDFRSSKLNQGGSVLPPEIALSIGFFERHPDEFFEYYYSNLVHEGAEPNAAHKKLAALEKSGKLTHIITQNVDGLHEKAGSKNIINLHGSIYSNHCKCCRKSYSLKQIKALGSVPTCTDCGAIIKPDVVLYGEGLSVSGLISAERAIKDADTMIVAGTSLVVQPAASLIFSFKGDNLVFINKTKTPMDYMATLTIHAPVGEVLDSIKVRKPRIHTIDDISKYLSRRHSSYKSHEGRE